ncbi:methionyl-tRNA formyltransferase [Candidatus Uhrbacteria bacterium]|nr:methionyl-tRNA formyltransferase [Candidatus Uhrbacteria bacterium]
MHQRLVFFGTPEFAVPTLTALDDAGFEIAAVVTQPDKPVGRGLRVETPPVKVKAEELGLTVLQPLSLGNAATSLSDELRADFGVVVAYGKIIPKDVLNVFPRGILNVHPSRLPKYRGPSPIQAAILNGDRETGVTIMLLDEGMDHGAILAQAKIAITPKATGNSLNETLAQTGAKLLVETLPKYLAGEIKPQEQDHAQATYTKILTREDGHIDWNKPAQYIERQVRAYDAWPGTWTLWERRRLKILRAVLRHNTIGCAANRAPGYVWKPEDRRLAVNCGAGSLILEQLQIEGKKPMSADEFLRGYPKFLGGILR